MKKYHIILILIVMVNLMPYFFINNKDSERWTYSPTMQSDLKVEINEQELEVEHKIWVSGFVKMLTETSSRTTVLIFILYTIVFAQWLIKKRKKANQPSEPIATTPVD
ncbi:MAG: hypothetical protein K9M45_14180 [Kiritimatiellales bacterium]|nr:hypothetical protein [Kiritimatiellales bacterium]